MSAQIQVRRDTAANWAAAGSPVLASGEVGFETDTGNFKVGDGSTGWNALIYALPRRTGARSSATGNEVYVDNANHRVGINNASPTVSLDVTGAVKISSTLAVTGASTLTGDVSVPSTTDSTSGSTGAVTTAGGIGAQKAIYAGTTINAGTTVTSGTIVAAGTQVTIGTSAPVSANHATRKDYVDAADTALVPATTITDQVGSRLVCTANQSVYQNTSTTKNMVVYVCWYFTTATGSGISVQFYVGDTSTPNKIIIVHGQQSSDVSSGTRYTACLIVPPQKYYKVVKTDNATNPVSVQSWFEYT